MKSRNDIKATIQVQYHSESDACIFALVNLTLDSKGHCTAANTRCNFPKSICTMEIKEGNYFITAPTWLLDKQKIKYNLDQ